MASKLFDRAVRFQKTFAAAMPNLPDGIQTALKATLGTADVTWALALVLAGWRLQKEADSGDASVALRETGAQELVNEIDSLSIALPEPFKQALTAAEAEDAAFAGAATYLSTAFNDMIDLQRTAVVKWLGGKLFREAGASLTRRIQAPASQLPSTWGAPPPAAEAQPPTPTPAPSQPSRLERFERADRPRRVVPAVAVVDQALPPPSPSAPVEPIAPPTPQLPPQTIARLHLMTEGRWPANEAERILSGPTGDTGSALQLRQFLRTYASLSLPQRARFQALVEQNEEGFEVSRTALIATSISDIQNVRSVDGLPQKTGVELFGIYEGLSAPERQRALRWIVDQESSAFGNPAQLQLPTLYATYRNLPKYERMRFLKVVDEIEEEGKKDAWKTADVGWVSSASPNPTISTATGLYRAYRRLSLPKRMSLVRAAIDNEEEFTLDEMNKTGLGKISPQELE